MVWWGRNRPCFSGVPKFTGFGFWSFFELFNSRISEVTQKVTKNRSPEQSYRRYEFFRGQLPPPNYKKKMFFWPFRGDNFSQGRDFWSLFEQNSELANSCTFEVTQKVIRNRSPEKFLSPSRFWNRLSTAWFGGAEIVRAFWGFQNLWASISGHFLNYEALRNFCLLRGSEIVCPQHGLVGPKSSVLFGDSKIYGLRFVVIFWTI